jgi:hypothetical protein
MKRTWRITWTLLTAAALSVPALGGSGIYLEQKISTIDEGRRQESHMRTWVQGDKMRIEFLEGGGPVSSPGIHLLSVDGGRTFHAVDPEAKTYYEYNIMEMAQGAFSGMEEMQQALGEGQQAGVAMQFEMSDPFLEMIDSGPGESILGYSTTRHRWRSGYSMRMKMMFIDNRHDLETLTETWVTSAIATPALRNWHQSQMSTGNAELDRVLIEPLRGIDGVPLKSVQESTMTDGRGRTSRSRTVTEVTTVREETIDASLFLIPGDYTEVSPTQVPTQVAQGSSGADSPARASSRETRQEPGEADGIGALLGAFGGGGRQEEEQGGSGRMGGLGGLFGGSRGGDAPERDRASAAPDSAPRAQGRTGGMRAALDGRSGELGFFRHAEGNSAAWMPLDDGTFAVFLTGFADERLQTRGAVSIRLVMGSLAGRCPCTPREAVIRYYNADSLEADLFESVNVRVVLSKLQQVEGGGLEIEGTYAGRFGHLRALGGEPGRSVAGEGRFQATATRVVH